MERLVNGVTVNIIDALRIQDKEMRQNLVKMKETVALAAQVDGVYEEIGGLDGEGQILDEVKQRWRDVLQN